MRKSARLALLFSFLFFLGAEASPLSLHSAHAAPPAPAPRPPPAPQEADEQRALALFEKSNRAYRDGDFQQAVTLLKQAYAIKPVPVLLYNLGRGYEGLGDPDNALKAYTDYLKAQPDAPDRGGIEKRIATLKEEVEERERLRRERESAEARAAQAPATEPYKRSIVPWIVAGAGGATIAAGVVFGVLAQGKHSTATNDPQQASAAQEQSDAKSFATTANVLFVAGGVLAGAGLLWGILASTSSPSTPQTGRASPPVRATLGLASVGLTVDLP